MDKVKWFLQQCLKKVRYCMEWCRLRLVTSGKKAGALFAGMRRGSLRKIQFRHILIALIAILILFGIVFGISRFGNWNPNGPDPAETKDPGEGKTVTLSFAGDCTLGTDIINDHAGSFRAMYEKQGPEYFFKKVLPVFEEDDLTVVNLEGTFTDLRTRASKTYAFRGDPSYTKILTAGNIEVVNLANNHSHDYGDRSYADTIEAIEKAGITGFGYNRSFVVPVNGIRVGFAGIYGLDDGVESRKQVPIQINALKAEEADLIIVTFHWGTERKNTPDPLQIELAHAAVDNGADLVVGHHPHVLQGIEDYNGAKIVYSLGNFCFGGNRNPADKDTMIFQQSFRKKDGKMVALDAEIIPCSLSSSKGYNDYQPTILTGSEKERVLKKIDSFSARIPSADKSASSTGKSNASTGKSTSSTGESSPSTGGSSTSTNTASESGKTDSKAKKAS